MERREELKEDCNIRAYSYSSLPYGTFYLRSSAFICGQYWVLIFAFDVRAAWEPRISERQPFQPVFPLRRFRCYPDEQ